MGLYYVTLSMASMMKPFYLLALSLIPVFVLAGCAPASLAKQPTQLAATTSILTPGTIEPGTATPEGTVGWSSEAVSPTITQIPFDTLEPAEIAATLQPLKKDPMNCTAPCFWGIIPEKTSFEEARMLFGKLGFTPFERIYEGNGFYTILYDTASGRDSSVTLHISNNLVETIEITPDIPETQEGNPREWIAYSPETLIRRYGSPSRVEFAVGLGPNIGINMIMYFDPSDLIVHYSGYNMDPKRFCPLTAPFDHVRLWMGANPPNMPSFETMRLEKATSLTMAQFNQLMAGDPKKACFGVKAEAFP